MQQRIGKYRRSTTYTLSFPTLPERKGIPSRVELIEQRYGHDVLKLDFNITNENWITTIKTGLPVKFEWTQGKLNRTWVGYVSFVSREKAAQLKQRMVVTCIGASFVLKQNSSRVFKNTTILEAAKTVVKENGLSLSTEANPNLVRYEQLTVSNESYWEWLCRRAKSMGYGLRTTGTDIEFKPIQSFVDGTATDVPILQHWGEHTPTDTHSLAPTLDNFQVLNGEFIESSNMKRTVKNVAGFNPITGKEFFTEATPLKADGSLRENVADVIFDERITDFVSSDKEMAKSKAEGAALLSRYNIPARALGQGDPRIRPFSLVYVDGTGSESDGYWMVDKVHHVMELYGTYHVDIRLLSDGAGKSKETLVRPATATLSGTVNLTEAILSKRKHVATVSSKNSVLESRGQIIRVGDQGFNRTPSRWAAQTKETS